MGESIAIISDIHGNSLALEAVLKDIAARDIQRIVNLGDSLFGPVDPLGSALQLRSCPQMIHIMGNCDQLLLEEDNKSATFWFVKPFIQAGVRYKKQEHLAAELQEASHPYIFCGHSHMFRMMHLPDGKVIVNAGSVEGESI